MHFSDTVFISIFHTVALVLLSMVAFGSFFDRSKFFKSQSEHMIQEEVYFQIREINLYQSKKSVKWHGLWRTLFRTSNIVSLCLGPYLEVECMNQKTKLSIESHIIGDQNDIWVVGPRCFI